MLHALAAAASGEGVNEGARATWRGIAEKLTRMIAERAGATSLGPVVYRLTLALEDAPTLNRYGSMKPWMQKKLRDRIGKSIMATRGMFPQARAREGERRAVRVTRHSSSCPDELGVDVLGGKVPVDCLVRAGILAGDTMALLERDGRWEKAAPGAGRLVVEVFQLLR